MKSLPRCYITGNTALDREKADEYCQSLVNTATLAHWYGSNSEDVQKALGSLDGIGQVYWTAGELIKQQWKWIGRSISCKIYILSYKLKIPYFF